MSSTLSLSPRSTVAAPGDVVTLSPFGFFWDVKHSTRGGGTLYLRSQRGGRRARVEHSDVVRIHRDPENFVPDHRDNYSDDPEVWAAQV